MIHHYKINGLSVSTGDLICTMDGRPDILPGEFWRLVGRLVPGEVDHIVVYLGPDGRCAESGSRGVITFEVHGGLWDSGHAMPERGLLVDTFYGVSYPLEDRGLPPEAQDEVRAQVAAFCLSQIGKPYNLNFMNPDTEDAFYCSQLAYRAYRRCGIDLNTGLAMESVPGTDQIIFPQELWEGSPHRRAENIARSPASG